jgi:hypothetical protein
MLSGIKTGKKKKRKITEEHVEFDTRRKEDKVAKKQPEDSNVSVAEQIRQQLASGIVPTSRPALQDRLSRIAVDASNKQHDDDDNVVVLTGAAVAADSSRPDYRPEDFRHGSRKGKLKRDPVDIGGTSQTQADMTIQQMLYEERSNTRSMDEVYARNVARVGSRYKGTDFKASSATGADEDDHQVDMTMFSSQKLTTVAAQQKERSRQVATHDKEQALTRKFSWWMESSSFPKHTLLALGNHVSMVMTPPHLSLFPGNQVYLVPIKHAESLVNCEDDVWNEIARFQSSLRDMYALEKKGVIFCETVLPSKGLWHTKMEAIPIPKNHDAPMYFKSALTEQAEEWGTHTKLLSTRDKGLRRSIPKRFPYFYVEWAPGSDGFAQIIETQSFPKDFGVDTVAGVLEMDPIRFRRKQTLSVEQEKQLVLDFLQKWKPFDWTVELD